ncbi:putative dehydrogenase [Paenibacillus taihuensis]|uniref:Putative dehydrogenase n=1 Tax=Paenibacillus taihuensis TaxID=1156355 RepID=A0A3D9Q3X3_9BACL|nr:Gfo/Idh/MocA family oxidoreductase [Paenibacillus taihuensis]REE57441.1 putative dehydrogenase [Paenibacillus taihuensis]
MSRVSPLRAVVVGCNMGKNQAVALAASDDYELVAVCDLNEETAKKVAEACGDLGGGSVGVYTDYAAMLAAVQPDVVVIATPNTTHAPFTLLAVEAGVRGIYCEKPMATNLGDARKMVEVCRERGVVFVVGHQRRTSAVYRKMRELIDAGTIGDVRFIRASCAGDLLSDGSHLADSMLYLLHEREVRWAIGQICRKEPASREEAARNPYAYTGRRYGHAVESGALAMYEFDGGVRGELHCGDMQVRGGGYQDFEIVGTAGSIWRRGDGSQPPLLVSDTSAEGGWRSVEVEEESSEAVFAGVFGALAASIWHGTPNPLDGTIALRGLEMLIAVFESSRLRAKIEFPVEQEGFPLDLILAEEQAAAAGAEREAGAK